MGSASEAMPTGVMPIGVVPTGLAPGGTPVVKVPEGEPHTELASPGEEKKEPSEAAPKEPEDVHSVAEPPLKKAKKAEQATLLEKLEEGSQEHITP